MENLARKLRAREAGARVQLCPPPREQVRTAYNCYGRRWAESRPGELELVYCHHAGGTRTQSMQRVERLGSSHAYNIFASMMQRLNYCRSQVQGVAHSLCITANWPESHFMSNTVCAAKDTPNESELHFREIAVHFDASDRAPQHGTLVHVTVGLRRPRGDTAVLTFQDMCTRALLATAPAIALDYSWYARAHWVKHLYNAMCTIDDFVQSAAFVRFELPPDLAARCTSKTFLVADTTRGLAKDIDDFCTMQ